MFEHRVSMIRMPGSGGICGMAASGPTVRAWPMCSSFVISSALTQRSKACASGLLIRQSLSVRCQMQAGSQIGPYSQNACQTFHICPIINTFANRLLNTGADIDDGAGVRVGQKLMCRSIRNQGENVAMEKNSYISSLSDSRLDTQSQLLEVAVAQAFNAVVITDAEMADGGPFIRYCNKAFTSMTGYSTVELLGRSPRMLQGPETDPQVIGQLRQCLAEGRFFEGSAVNYRKDGTPYHVSWNISAVRDVDGKITHFVSVQQDVTQQVESERQRDLMIQALNSANAPVFITDRNGYLVFVNDAFERQTGYCAAEVMGRTPAMLHSGSHTAQFYSELRDALVRGENFSRTFINRRKDGELYHASQSISALRDARHRITHYVSISKDISDLVQREQELLVRAYRDDLTGLPNRSAGSYELENCQRIAERQGVPYALIMCDVDLFKQVNDQFGHEAGDQVLQQIAKVLRSTVRSSEHVARWGGEEFLIIVPGVGLQAALELAERLRRSIASHSYAAAGTITMSFGVGGWQVGEASAQLLHRTDMALYRAKSSGRNQVQRARYPDQGDELERSKDGSRDAWTVPLTGAGN